MNRDEDYQSWLQHRRDVNPPAELSDRIMQAVAASRGISPQRVARSPAIRARAIPVLLWTAASLIFVARIAALVGNLIFPTSSYPEFAADHRIEGPDEQRESTRS
jgi:hypothetical protein